MENNTVNVGVNKIIYIVKLIALIMLENGAETYRVEDTIVRVCHSFGFRDVEAIVIPTGVFITISRDEHIDTQYTIVKRVKRRSVDLSKINSANNISRLIAEEKISVDQAITELKDIMLSSPRKKLIPITAAGLSAGFFTLLFGGTIFDFSIAVLCGAVVQFLAYLFSKEDMFHFIISLIGGIVTAFIAICATQIFKYGNIELIISGAIMPLLPGLAMTNAIRDSMRGDLVSGVTRGTEAIIVAIALAIGVMIILKSWLLLGGGLSL